MAKIYKVRSFKNGQNKNGDAFMNHSITVPGHIAEILPVGMLFKCNVTEDGILYSPALDQEQAPPPTWAKSD